MSNFILESAVREGFRFTVPPHEVGLKAIEEADLLRRVRALPRRQSRQILAHASNSLHWLGESSDTNQAGLAHEFFKGAPGVQRRLERLALQGRVVFTYEAVVRTYLLVREFSCGAPVEPSDQFMIELGSLVLSVVDAIHGESAVVSLPDGMTDKQKMVARTQALWGWNTASPDGREHAFKQIRIGAGVIDWLASPDATKAAVQCDAACTNDFGVGLRDLYARSLELLGHFFVGTSGPQTIEQVTSFLSFQQLEAESDSKVPVFRSLLNAGLLGDDACVLGRLTHPQKSWPSELRWRPFDSHPNGYVCWNIRAYLDLLGLSFPYWLGNVLSNGGALRNPWNDGIEGMLAKVLDAVSERVHSVDQKSFHKRYDRKCPDILASGSGHLFVFEVKNVKLPDLHHAEVQWRNIDNWLRSKFSAKQGLPQVESMIGFLRRPPEAFADYALSKHRTVWPIVVCSDPVPTGHWFQTQFQALRGPSEVYGSASASIQKPLLIDVDTLLCAISVAEKQDLVLGEVLARYLASGKEREFRLTSHLFNAYGGLSYPLHLGEAAKRLFEQSRAN